ncbi:MAG: polysaccharide deacetylase family protein [Nocardioidaceae bacterium]
MGTAGRRRRTAFGAAGLLTGLAAVAGCAAAQNAEPAAIIAPATSSPVPSPTCTVPAKFAGQDVERLPVAKKLVALTFDAGANAAGVPSILATLHKRQAKATFFLTGNFVNAFPVRSANIAKSYVVGNHTMTHPNLVDLLAKSGRAAVRGQIRQAQAAIVDVTGQDPRRFFRFPFGAVNPTLISIANNNCYVPFRWTVDSLGWKGTKKGGMTRAKVVKRVVGAATPGEIVLMHVGSNPDDGTTLDADALPAIITQLRAKGYSFVSLARVMSAAP